MNLQLQKSAIISGQTLFISGSKSETNRLLLLKAQFPEILVSNISNSDDSQTMRNSLENDSDVVDIGHAGTAMRFLTAWFAIQPGKSVLLTGSQRMQQRPIGVLVDALRELGAQIEYVNQQGYPPLRISGTRIVQNEISIDANVSSQFISALLLIAPSLEAGLTVKLTGVPTSVSYIKMTISLLERLGVDVIMGENTIQVKPFDKASADSKSLIIESDWSSASYYYSIIALSEIGATISLTNFYSDSLQGDRVVADIYKSFGVETTFEDGKITIVKVDSHASSVDFDLSNCPDLAQTIAVTSFALGCLCKLRGLKTLKIKETDRLVALRNELSKLGADVVITNDSLEIKSSTSINDEVRIATYDDHRMAMAFAPLALLNNIIIGQVDVVSKSYPEFWIDLKRIGYNFTPVK